MYGRHRFLPWFGGDSGSEPRSYRAWKWLWQRATSRAHSPDLFERIEITDWDLLIVLDACRYDVLADVAGNAAIDSAISPVCVTQQFVESAARDGAFDGTTYVSANPASRAFGDGVDHVPAYETDWDDDLGTVRPEAVYDVAVERVRAGQRVVAHTMQPHYPHVCRIRDEVVPVPGGLHPAGLGASQDETPAQNIPFAFFTGATDVRRARQSYRACTKFAWESVVDRAAALAADGYRVAITADHGELLGEWGLYGHPWRIRLRPLVEVPWVVFDPAGEDARHADTVEEKLEALGYV